MKRFSLAKTADLEMTREVLQQEALMSAHELVQSTNRPLRQEHINLSAC